ncbi:FAD-dependent oxidoreductase [Agromyces sp. NPDC058136]|uniref:FAD-dependent oxidoreductase n=1 Tax=Agromyces sp. NPDC058136 TaxID=3346354 RepID=UPI0036DE7C32
MTGDAVSGAGPSGAVERVGVAIVGGGPVGLLLGCLLAARDVSVAVVERRTEVSTRARAIGVHAPGFAVLAEAGVGDELAEQAITITGGEVSCAGRVLGRMRFPEASAVWSLPQHLVEAALERRLAELAPGALRRGVEAGSVRGVRGGVELSPTGESGGAPLRADYLVVAAGVRSRLRESFGVGWRRAAGSARYAMADVAFSEGAPDDELAQLRFEADGVVESLPMPGGRRWVAHLGAVDRGVVDRGAGAVLADAADPAVEPAVIDAAAFAEIIAVRTGVQLDPAAIEPSVFEARQHLASRFAAGRLALAGDTAHELSPIGGQGMTLGFLDAFALAAVLPEALAMSDPAPFAHYARTRRRAAARACRRARFNMAMGAPARGIRLTLRNAVVRMLAVPPVRAVLARTFTMRGL